MNNLNKKIYIELIIFLIVGLLIFLLIISPLFKGIKAVYKEIFDTRESMASLQTKNQQDSALREQFKSFSYDLEKIQGLFIDLEMPIVFLQFLEDTGENTNVLIETSLLSEKEEKTDSFPALNFQLTLTGSSSDCLEFLEKLETVPYLIEIDDLTIRRLNENQLKQEKYEQFSDGDVVFNLVIKVFAK
ncbi:MAG: hypothetical protein ISS87_01285 [Candidatus Pacebacteria bacterium]|nr:hypothetical protein [Candidatus Paceibacterota bacterium]